MSGTDQHPGNAPDHQVCHVYPHETLTVHTGVNAGEPVAGASSSCLGDTYVFSDGAHAREVLVPQDGTTPNDHHHGGTQPVLGRDIHPDSRLTFMGSDGKTVDVIVMTGENPDHPAGFLPLAPLVPGQEYTLIKTEDDPGEIDHSDHAVVCFARGTLIRMADGTEKTVETLTTGDLVLTRDNGAQPVRWVGSRTVPAYGHLAPIVISKGALGNHSDLIVSPQHRMLISDWRAEVMLGSLEVLVKARDLVNGETIYCRQGGVVEYFHILFDNHEIIFAEGIPSESLHINRSTLDSMAEESRAEIIELFPGIVEQRQVSAVASRMSLKSYEAAALLKQVGFR